MSNPSSITSLPACVITNSTTAVDITMDAARQYMLSHDGQDASGNAQTETIWCAVNTTAPAASEGANKFKLVSGAQLLIGPGVTQLSVKASANDPGLSVLPVDHRPGNY